MIIDFFQLYISFQVSKKHRLGANPSVRKEQLEAIEKKISDKTESLAKPDIFRGAKYMSRQEMDLEKAISHGTEKANLLACLMTSDKLIHSKPQDTSNHLDNLWEEVLHKQRIKETSTTPNKYQTQIVACSQCHMEYYRDLNGYQGPVAKDKSFDLCEKCTQAGKDSDKEIDHQVTHENDSQTSKSKRRRGRRGKRVGNLIDDTNDQPISNNDSSQKGPSENEGMKFNSNEVTSDTDNKHDKPTKRKKRKVKKVEVGPTTITGYVEQISLDHILNNRLSLKQIKEVPRFQDYTSGEPSQVSQ